MKHLSRPFLASILYLLLLTACTSAPTPTPATAPTPTPAPVTEPTATPAPPTAAEIVEEISPEDARRVAAGP